MKQIPLLQGKALLIEMTEGAKDLDIFKAHYGQQLMYTDQFDCGLTIDLPSGNWRIIGMLGEVREEDAAKLVDYTGWGGGPDYWQDYTRPKGDCKTALESLESAILAEDWCFENPYGEEPVRLPEGHNSHGTHESMWNQWKEGQSRVLDRSRCLLLGEAEPPDIDYEKEMPHKKWPSAKYVARKVGIRPFNTQNVRPLVNQLVGEEISFSRFIELLNEIANGN